MAEHGDNAVLVSKLVPLFKKYNVQAYFNGHDHVLQVLQFILLCYDCLLLKFFR